MLNLEGKHVFVTRYVRPQNPPQEFLDDTNATRLEQMVRGTLGASTYLKKCTINYIKK